MISSVGNPTIRRVRRLRKRMWRERTARFVVEGHRAVGAALDAGASLHLILHTPRATQTRAALLARATEAGIPIHEVTPMVMAAVASSATLPDVAAVAPIAERGPAALDGGASGVLLSGVRDPAAVGGILAAAAAAGGSVAVLASGSADVYAPSVARSALGAHFRLDIVRGVDAGDAVARARAGGTRVVGLGSSGPPAWTADLKGPMLLHVDGDGKSQGDPVRGLDGDIEPPLTARAASVLYEWLRQRGES